MVKVKSEREQVQSVTTKLKGHYQQIELNKEKVINETMDEAT